MIFSFFQASFLIGLLFELTSCVLMNEIVCKQKAKREGGGGGGGVSLTRYIKFKSKNWYKVILQWA